METKLLFEEWLEYAKRFAKRIIPYHKKITEPKTNVMEGLDGKFGE